jgi:hypothetical protein
MGPNVSQKYFDGTFCMSDIGADSSIEVVLPLPHLDATINQKRLKAGKIVSAFCAA